MKSLCSALLALALPGAALAPGAAKAAALNTDEEKTLYALGALLGGNISSFQLTPAEFKFVAMGLEDAVAGKAPQADPAVYRMKVSELAQKRQAAQAEKEKAKAKAFLEKTGQEKGAKVLPSGLVYKKLKAGKGAGPKASDTVKVHYRGTLTDGKEFDSSYKRNSPAEFPLNGVIPCWTEGVQMMKPGGKAQLVCPSAIAYGDRGSPPMIPGGATLVFEVELIEIVKR